MNKWRENGSTWNEKCDDKTTLGHLMGTMSLGDNALGDLKRPQNGIWIQGSDDGQTRVDFFLLLPFTHGFETQKG